MSSTEKNHTQSRERILRAAERLFAANGFGGTGVDAIARAAGINKATIYYYFPSKQSILDCLIEGFLTHFMETTVLILGNKDTAALLTQSISATDDTILFKDAAGIERMLGFLDGWIDHIIDLFTQNRDIIRIMFAESVKDGDNQQLLFRLSDLIASGASKYQQQLTGLGLPQLNLEVIVMKFFGGILPLAYYAVCSDAWVAHYGMTKQALKQGMTSLFYMELLGYYELTTVRGDSLK